MILCSCFQHKTQGAFPSILPVALLCLYESRRAKVRKCSPNGGFRQVQFPGNGRNGRPAGSGFVAAAAKIEIHRDGPVGQVHFEKFYSRDHTHSFPGRWFSPAHLLFLFCFRDGFHHNGFFLLFGYCRILLPGFLFGGLCKKLLHFFFVHFPDG